MTDKTIRWEYVAVLLREPTELERFLSEYGDAGWELVTVWENRLIFKKPLASGG